DLLAARALVVAGAHDRIESFELDRLVSEEGAEVDDAGSRGVRLALDRSRPYRPGVQPHGRRGQRLPFARRERVDEQIARHPGNLSSIVYRRVYANSIAQHRGSAMAQPDARMCAGFRTARVSSKDAAD